MESTRAILDVSWQEVERFLAGAEGCLLGTLDASGAVVSANPALAQRLGPGAMADALTDPARDRWNRALANLNTSPQQETLEIAFQNGPDTVYQCLVGRHGEGGYWMIAIRADPTLDRRLADLERARAQAERQALTDALTGLANRRQAEIWLGNAFQQAALRSESLACLMADLDQLKTLNDTHGHLAGDRALAAAGAAFRQGVRATDHVARYGGDEFLIVLPQTDLTGARAIARRLQSALAAEAKVLSPLCVTASFGAAALVPSAADPPELLRDRADAALLRAKRTGRNRIEAE